MDDDRTQREVDGGLRAAFAPDTDVVRRVAARALADDLGPAHRYWSRPALAVIAVALAAAIAGLVTLSRVADHVVVQPHDFSMSIVQRGTMLSVKRSDGGQWIVGTPSAENRRGRYVIVVQR
jgi:hypothetical protein